MDKEERKKKKELRKRRKQKFSLEQNPVEALIAVGIAVLSFGGLAAACISSGSAKGKGGLQLGVIGLICFVFSIFGLILAGKGFQKDEIRYRYPVLGLVLNSVLLILCLLLYIMGLVVYW